jgi:hypothetical protein
MPPAMPLCSFRANTEAGRALMRPAWRRPSLLRQAAQSPLLPVTAHPVFFRHIEAVKAEYERDGLYEAKKALGQKLFHLLVPESLRFLRSKEQSKQQSVSSHLPHRHRFMKLGNSPMWASRWEPPWGVRPGMQLARFAVRGFRGPLC